jgi:hypothetical protein
MSASAQALTPALTLTLTLALALALAGCNRADPFAAGGARAGAEPPDPGYRAPPSVARVGKSGDGSVTLSGRALPSSQVRMVSPAGASIETRADGSGAWTAALGPVSEPTLYRLAEDANGQHIDAEGLLAVLPGAPIVALLRAGAGAQVAPDADKAALRILAVDYDMAGAAVVSGRARPGAPVRVMVDGQVAMEGTAGADGRFALTLSKPLSPGRHRLQASTPQAAAEADVAVTPPMPPKNAPYQAQAQPFGWRVDWITPGGGAQTTLLLAG